MTEILKSTVYGTDPSETVADKSSSRETHDTRHLEIERSLRAAAFALRQTGATYRFSELSPAATDLFAVPTARLVDDFSRLLALLVPDDAVSLMETLRRASETGAPWQATLRHAVGGTVRWFEYRARPTKRTREGWTWRGTILDITRFKRRDTEMDDFRFAMDLAGDAVFWITADGGFTYVNEQACRSLGYAKEQLLEMTIPDIDPEFSEETWQRFWSALVDAGAISFETMHRRQDGTSFPVAITASHVKFDNTEYSCAFVTDITESHAMAEERERLARQLRHAQKMEAIGSLAGGIAHDFNNILFPIIAHTELLLSEAAEDTDNRESLEQVLAASMRAKELVKQILAISRRAETKIKPIHLSALVDEVLHLVRSSFPATIDIQSTLPDHIGQIMADPTHIHQIVLNLVTNAFHAMEETGGTLTVTVSERRISESDLTRVQLVEGTFVCLSVQDTGVGMTEAIRERIFEPYFTTKGQDKGTGLGLSVVHGIVRSLDGDIEVRTAPGEGTVFHIYLPRIAPMPDTLEPDPMEVSLAGDERLLVVDDDPPIVAAITRILTPLGYRVTGCTDSLEALSVVKAAPDSFDLLISDMTMPRLTGEQLALLVRKVRPDLPILLLTGFKNREMKERVADLGIDHLLMKPLRREKLAKEVRYALEGSQRS